MTLEGNLLDYASLEIAGDEALSGLGKQLNLDDDLGICGVATTGISEIGGDDLLFFKINTFSDVCVPSAVELNVAAAPIVTEVFSSSTENCGWTAATISYSTENVTDNQGFICEAVECLLEASFSWISPVCPDDSAYFDPSLTDGSFQLATWDFGDGSAVYNVGNSTVSHYYDEAGIYTVQLIVTDTAIGCSDTISMEVSIFEDALLGPDLVVCESQWLEMETGVSGADWDLQWFPPALFDDPTAENPMLYVDTTLTIWAEASNAVEGCVVIDTLTIYFDSVNVDILISDSLLCGTNGTNFIVPYSIYNLAEDPIWSPSSVLEDVYTDSVNVFITEDLYLSISGVGEMGCTSSDSIFIDYVEYLQPQVIDTVICDDSQLFYSPSGSWYSDEGPANLIIISEAGNYIYNETNACSTVEHELIVATKDCNCYVYVPNTFTPDGNGINDTFKPEFYCEFEWYQFNIFNRWGEVVFSTENPFQAWNGDYRGRLVQDGIYIWQLDYIDVHTGVPNQKRGHVGIFH